MRIAVVGSRAFPDRELVMRTLSERVDPMWDTIVSGGAKGADTLAQEWAKEHACIITIYYPNWKDHGRAAGMIRNRDIVAHAHWCIAFWDGESKGTKNTIDLFREAGKEVLVINA